MNRPDYLIWESVLLTLLNHAGPAVVRQEIVLQGLIQSHLQHANQEVLLHQEIAKTGVFLKLVVKLDLQNNIPSATSTCF